MVFVSPFRWARLVEVTRPLKLLEVIQYGGLCDGPKNPIKFKARFMIFMRRIREITMDGVTVKITPFSWDEAETYINDGKTLLARDPKPTGDDWALRTLQSVCFTLNKAAGKEEWDVKKLTTELDMVFIQFVYNEFMKMSGLRTEPTKGEAPATSTSL
jgi:hypothetical protein